MSKRKYRTEVEELLDDLRALADLMRAKLSTLETKIDEIEILLRKRS